MASSGLPQEALRQSDGVRSNEVPLVDSTLSEATGPANTLAIRVRAHLCQKVGHALPITYQALATELELLPPNTIHQLTAALECLIEEDAATVRPLIAALVVSKARGGLPAPGFFDCAQHVGRFDGDSSEPERSEFYAAEFKRAVEFWCKSAEGVEELVQARHPS